jgi:phosphoribosylformylglycinamidine cyclo-ligase
MLDTGLPIKAMIHITGDGLLNLARVVAPVGFVVDELPKTPPIFGIVQERAQVDDAEMYRVFNMGIGFCIVVPPECAEEIRSLAHEHGHESSVIGYAVADEARRIWIPEHGLVGRQKKFHTASGPAPSRPES